MFNDLQYLTGLSKNSIEFSQTQQNYQAQPFGFA
jgi:hypothetical protein